MRIDADQPTEAIRERILQMLVKSREPIARLPHRALIYLGKGMLIIPSLPDTGGSWLFWPMDRRRAVTGGQPSAIRSPWCVATSYGLGVSGIGVGTQPGIIVSRWDVTVNARHSTGF